MRRNIKNTADHKAIERKGSHAEDRTANGSFNGLFGTDVGNKLVTTDDSAGKIGKNIGDPRAHENEIIQIGALWQIMQRMMQESVPGM